MSAKTKQSDSEQVPLETIVIHFEKSKKALIDGEIYLLKTHASDRFPQDKFKIGKFQREVPTRWHGLQPYFYINSLEGYLSPSKVEKFALLKNV